MLKFRFHPEPYGKIRFYDYFDSGSLKIFINLTFVDYLKKDYPNVSKYVNTKHKETLNVKNN